MTDSSSQPGATMHSAAHASGVQMAVEKWSRAGARMSERGGGGGCWCCTTSSRRERPYPEGPQAPIAMVR